MPLKSSTDQAQKRAFVLLTAGVSAGFLWLVKGFWQPVFWGILLAIVFQPLYRQVLRLCHDRQRLGSVITVSSIVLGVVLPLFVLALAVMQESLSLYQQVLSGKIDIQQPVRLVEQSLPQLVDGLERIGIDFDRLREILSQTALRASQFLANHLFRIGQSTVQVLIQTLIMLYLLYFFFKDGQGIVNVLVRTIPLGDRRERLLFNRFAEVARATIKGTLVIGIVQGGIGGGLFWILGLQGALLWGVLMVLLSILPVVGSALVWGPAGIILIATGAYLKGGILLATGSVVIGLADNILRPALVGRETRLPDYLILLATLGGLAVYGLAGFVIGPVVAALFLTVWEMFGLEFGKGDAAAEEEGEKGLSDQTAKC